MSQDFAPSTRADTDYLPSSRLLPFPGFFRGSPLKPEPGARYSSMVSSLMHPLSRGSVHIASADPTAPPAIDPSECRLGFEHEHVF